jgi:hypothetical protein
MNRFCEILQKFADKIIVTVIFKCLLERLLNPQKINRIDLSNRQKHKRGLKKQKPPKDKFKAILPVCFFILFLLKIFLRPLGVQNLFCSPLECKIYFAAFWSAKFLFYDELAIFHKNTVIYCHDCYQKR